jgi:EAL domain-containing protein (putative c-di-GMP-specific phosphodiesterase class I)
VRNALARSRIEANRLRIEITESVLLDDSDENVRVLEELRAMGCRIAIDDFGTGYSSLSYLQRYPIDVVKIDRSFVTDASGDAARLAITESIVRLAGALDLACVAEGIESTHDRRLLESLGCRYGQGFLFSRPMPLDELLLMLDADVEEDDGDQTPALGVSRRFDRRAIPGRSSAKTALRAER